MVKLRTDFPRCMPTTITEVAEGGDHLLFTFKLIGCASWYHGLVLLLSMMVARRLGLQRKCICPRISGLAFILGIVFSHLSADLGVSSRSHILLFSLLSCSLTHLGGFSASPGGSVRFSRCLRHGHHVYVIPLPAASRSALLTF
jgi:hypothetical protein